MPPTDAASMLTRNVDDARRALDAVTELGPALQRAADLILHALTTGRKILACGNGGSACDAAHFTAEIAGRFVIERPGWPAVDLTADHAILTALLNDYPPREVFARRMQALGEPGDVLVVFSTSGKSANVVAALEAARDRGLLTVAFLGRDGGLCAERADVAIVVPSQVTARIQEAHLLLYHTLCEALDEPLANARRPGADA